jgi:hypothetical protein
VANSGSNFRFEGPENGESITFRTVHSFSARAFASRIFLPGSASRRSDRWRRGSFAADMGQIQALRSEEIAGELKRQDKRVILLWLAGGASQFETWDPKPGAKTGGPFRAIQTNATGVHISELLPELSQRMQHTAIIRSLNTKIADHGRGADLMETGRLKDPSILYPDLGAVVARELGRLESKVPDYVSLYTSTEGRRKGPADFSARGMRPCFFPKA